MTNEILHTAVCSVFQIQPTPDELLSPYLFNVTDSEAPSKLRSCEAERSECHPPSELVLLKKKRGEACVCRLDLKVTTHCRV